MSKQYNTIFVTQPAHDYSALAKYCNQVKFIQSGKEKTLQEAYQACIERLSEFNPKTDAIVVVGKVNGAFLAGMALAQIFQADFEFDMGVYIDVGGNAAPAKDYRWEKVHV